MNVKELSEKICRGLHDAAHSISFPCPCVSKVEALLTEYRKEVFEECAKVAEEGFHPIWDGHSECVTDTGKNVAAQIRRRGEGQ